MTKRGPLSKIEKFYITENNESMTVDEIATDLDRAKSVVKAFADKLKPKSKTEAQAKQTTISDQIFSNKRGSTVMTQNGSMLSDDFKKGSRGDSKRPKCVTEIK